MPAGRSNAAALLQKANSQLRGERVPLKTRDEDELATYLNSLTAKTQQARNVDFEEYGDISISSGAEARNSLTPRGRRSASPAGSAAPAPITSKYLKKKKPSDGEEREPEFGAGKSGRGGGIVIAGGKKVNASQEPKGRTALDKANALTNKIKGRAASASAVRRHVSMDSESETSIRGADPGPRPGSADTSIGRDGPKFLKSRKTVEDDDKPNFRAQSPQLVQRSFSVDKQEAPRKGSKSKGEIVRTLGKGYEETDEETFAEFMHGLSASESSAKRPANLVAKKQQKWRKTTASPLRKTPSPVHRPGSPSPYRHTPSPLGKLSRSLSQDSDLMESMASEVHDRKRGRHDSGSSDDFKINLMDITSLLPASTSPTSDGKKKNRSKKTDIIKSSSSSFRATSPDVFKAKDKKKPAKKSSKSSLKKSDSKSSLFETLGIHMVDELLEVNVDKKQDAEIDLSDESEIKTERSDNHKKAFQRQASESEIITEIGASQRKPVPQRMRSPAMSISERIGVVSSVVRKQSSALDSSATDIEDYSESFETETDSRTVTSPRPRDRRSSRRRQSSRDDSYSRQSRQHKVVMEEKRVDISAADPRGGTHHWNATQTGFSISGPYGLQYVDPAPVATHIVSADDLEALTAYSPNMLALQDMMRAQLELVKNFVDIQHRIYKSCMDGLSYDFKYTTLEDTKEYIRKNRKPRMTFKEALKLVEQEEGITA